MELTVRRSAAVRRTGHAQRHRLRGQLGLTLPELVVAMAVLSIIAGSIAGAFGIGLRLLGPAGAPARLTLSADLLAFEQQIGADVARADCLAAPAQTSIPTTGCTLSVEKNPSSTCGTAFSQSNNPTGYVLCLAWYVPGSACHTVTYSQRSNGTVVRSDLTPSSNTSARIATGGLQITAAWTPAPTSNNSYKWTKQVTITVKQVTIPGAPAAKVLQPVITTFQLVPLAADPLSPVLAGLGITSPC
jgi:prepilin-type N-terminal cleavage/methylation domain-containing protein